MLYKAQFDIFQFVLSVALIDLLFPIFLLILK